MWSGIYLLLLGGVFAANVASNDPSLDHKKIEDNGLLFERLFPMINTIVSETSRLSESQKALTKALLELIERQEKQETKLAEFIEENKKYLSNLEEGQEKLETKQSEFIEESKKYFSTFAEGFETGNGIKRDEVGHLQGGWPHGSLDVKGSYSYTGDDGKVYSVSYKADSNGFHAEGAHLPTPPPIPKEIQKTLHLHQRRPGGSPASGSYGGGQYGSSAHHGSLGHNNNAGASSHHHHHNPPPHRTPSTQYLPPPQASSFHYSKRH